MKGRGDFSLRALTLAIIRAILRPQLGMLGLTLVASATICAGAFPENLQIADWLAPVLALFSGAFFEARGQDFRVGWRVAACNFALYFAVFLGLATRFSPEFWRDSWLQFSVSHALWWALIFPLCLFGAWCGAKIRARHALIFPAGALLMAMIVWFWPGDENAVLKRDGTTVRVREFDLQKVNFGIYDADSDDSRPFDERNASWLGQAMPRVWQKISARGQEPLCLVNGGFFGAVSPLIAVHEAPIRQNGRSYYDASILEADWPDQNATLVWKRKNGLTQPEILLDARFDNLEKFEQALGGVRVLRKDRRDFSLAPGMGGATLKTNRTSVGWNRKTGKFWVLSVRDPDGEASSVRANAREKRGETRVQKGGWDVRQVADFWKKQGASDAVLFDGGESGQIFWRNGEARHWRHSSYHFTRTLGFWNAKPLRVVWPLLPPSLGNGGVLNWFWVEKTAV